MDGGPTHWSVSIGELLPMAIRMLWWAYMIMSSSRNRRRTGSKEMSVQPCRVNLTPAPDLNRSCLALYCLRITFRRPCPGFQVQGYGSRDTDRQFLEDYPNAYRLWSELEMCSRDVLQPAHRCAWTDSGHNACHLPACGHGQIRQTDRHTHLSTVQLVLPSSIMEAHGLQLEHAYS